MNYAGTFDATFASDGQGTPSHAYIHADSSAIHAPADAIVVPDAHLLFHGDFKRSGVDLILSGDEREFVVHDYFKGAHHRALASPDGAHLTADLVKALTGEVEVSQADNAAQAGNVIGHVTKLVGNATVVRNGVSIILNMGDNVEKGDVVQSGSDSTLGITFIDGTVFGLSSNARMVLNEMVYDPNGSNNSSLLSLVAGTITFVAGETAKHGDMKIDTPVATMGIRGTAVLVEIDFTVPGQGAQPNASFQVLVEPDGTTGSYVLFDKTTLQPIAIVQDAKVRFDINQYGVSQSSAQFSPDILKLINGVFEQKFSDNSSTKSTTNFTDSIYQYQNGPLIKLANGTTAQPVYLVTNATTQGSNTSPTNAPIQGLTHISGAPTFASLDTGLHATTSFQITEIAGKTGIGTANPTSGIVNFVDPNSSDRPTVAVNFFQAQFNGHSGGGSLLAQDILASEIQILVVPGAGNNNNGTALWTYSLPDKAFDFLAAGETLTLTYAVTVSNNYAPAPESVTFPITITITGTNDQPVITTGPQSIAFTGGTSKSGGPLELVSGATKGQLTFTDVDLSDTHTVAVSLETPVLTDSTGKVVSDFTVAPAPLAAFEQALTALINKGDDSIGTGKGIIDWTFATPKAFNADIVPKGDTLTLTYDVTVTDSSGADNATSKLQTVTVTITGTDHPAVVWIATTTDGGTSGGFWSNPNNWETGIVPIASDDVIVVTNQLLGETPSFPATIDSETNAVGHSLTMNDFNVGVEGAQPKLINQGSLAIGDGGISLNDDAVIDNQGSMSVTGAFEFHDHDAFSPSATLTFTNTGLLVLFGGGDFIGPADVTNAGTFELARGTLNVGVDIANSDGDNSGLITVDAGATMVLNPSTISGGRVANYGTVNLDGASGLKNGSLTNVGQVNVSGSGNVFDGEKVANNSQNNPVTGTAVTNDNASGAQAITVDTQLVGTAGVGSDDLGTAITDGSVLTIDGKTITFSVAQTKLTVDESGNVTIGIEAGSTLTVGNLLAAIDAITGTSVPSTVNAAGEIVLSTGATQNLVISGTGNVLAALGLAAGTVNFAGAIDVTGALTLDDGASITNASSVNTVTVEDGATLTLTNASINGGTVTNTAGGTIDLDGAAVLSGGTLVNHGDIVVSGAANKWDAENVTANGGTEITSGGTLTIDQNSTVANTQTTVDSAGTLTLTSASLNDGTVTNASGGAIDLNGNAVLSGGTLANNGHIFVSGAANKLDAETVTANASLEVTSGGSLTIDQNSTVANTQTTVDSAGTLILTSASLNGGTVTNASGGTIDLNGAAVLSGGTLINNGKVNVSGTGNTLNHETTTNDGAIDITGALTLLNGGSITNGASDTITVESAGSLTLNDTSFISGGILTNSGSVSVEASTGAVLDAVSVHNSGGIIHIDVGTLAATLILKDGTTVSGGTISAGSVGTLEVSTVLGATLTGVIVDNSNIVKVDAGSQLLLSQDTFNGGTLSGTGTIATTTGNTETTLNGVTIASGTTVTAAAGILDLKGTIANSGAVDATTGTVNLDGATFNGGTLGGTGTVNVVAASMIESATLSSAAVNVTAKLTLNGDTVTGTTITDKGGGIELDNTVKLTGGATIEGQSSEALGATTNLGTLEVSGTATLLNETLTNTGHTVHVDATTGVLDLNTSTINSGALNIDGELDSNGTSFLNGVTIDNTSHIKTVSGTLTIDPAPFTNTGTVEVENGTTLVLNGETVTNGAGDTNGSFQVDGDGTHFGTLNLESSTLNGGAINIFGVLNSTGTSFIDGATIDNTGTLEVTSGTLTIDANSTLTNTGSLAADGGNLIVDAAVSGNLTIFGASTLDLGANAPTAYSQATVTFEPGSTGTLEIDHSRNFHGTVVGLEDDNKLDLADIAYSSNPTVSYANGTLSVFVDGVDVADIKLSGNYSGVHWALAADGNGTDITEVPGALSGLDANGNAAQGVALTASVTDGGQSVSGATFEWQIFNGSSWVPAGGTNGGSTYTPVESDEGHQLRVSLSFTDGSGNSDTSTVSAGVVQETPAGDLVVTLSSTKTNEGALISVTQVTDGGNVVSSGLTYLWEVSSDGGGTWTPAHGAGNNNSSYTPVEADQGLTLGVLVTNPNDPDGSESVTKTVGTVGEIAGGDLVVTLSSTTTSEGAPISVTEVTDGGNVVSSGLTYLWEVSSDGGSTWTPAHGAVNNASHYTPVEADQGLMLGVLVTNPNGPGGSESLTTAVGKVGEVAGGDLVATLSTTTAHPGTAIQVESVTDGGVTVSSGLVYQWEVSSDGGSTWSPAHGTLGQSSYTPVEADEGQKLELVVTNPNGPGGSESVTYQFGLVSDLVVTLNTAVAAEGLKATVTAVSDGGGRIATNSTSLSYAWELSSDGSHWTTVSTNSSYAPVEADEGKTLRLVTTYAEPDGNNDQATNVLGIVGESQGGLVVTLSSTTTDEGAPTSVTQVTDGGNVVSSGLTYLWEVSSDGGSTWTPAHGEVNNASSYTPVEADQGLTLGVLVTDPNAPGGSVSVTTAVGTVGEIAGGDLVVTLSSTSTNEGTAISVTQVTDGGHAVSSGLTYLWEVSSDGGSTWTPAHGAVNNTSSYTPVEADQGLTLGVLVTNPNAPGGSESLTTAIGKVGEVAGGDLVATLSSTTAQQGTTIQVESVTDGGVTVASGLVYQWEVSSDGGSTWSPAHGTLGQSSYTPVEGDEGQKLELVVTNPNAPGGSESATYQFGTVGEAQGGDLAVSFTTATVQEGLQITVSGVTDGGAAVATNSASLAYAWEVSSDGSHWTTVSTTSYYAPVESDEGKTLRLVTTYTEPSGGSEQATNVLGSVGDITPTLIAPFNFAVDEFKVTKGTAVFDDTFTQGPPPTGGLFGGNPVVFIDQGSTWTEAGGKAIMSSNNVIALPTVNGGEVIARLNTNNQDQSVSDLGLKEDTTFKVSTTFDLIAPPNANDQYGIDLNDTSATHANDDMVELFVVGDGAGGATVKLVEADFATTTFHTLESVTLTAAQLLNSKIELDLAHNTAGSSAVSASFELFNGTSQTPTFTYNFAAQGTVFDNTTYTRADIFGFGNTGVVITGQAQQGQTLTANTSTNDADATINYQWEHSSDGTNWTNIGTNSATYVVQESDEGDQIRVVASMSDPDSTQPPATATSAATGPVQEAPGGDLVATIDSTTAQQNTTIHVTQVTDGGVVAASGLTYQWEVSSDGGSTRSAAHGTLGQSSYTPVEADEGQQLKLVVTNPNDPSGPESTTYTFGTVTESANGDLVATIDSTTAQQNTTIHVTQVTDGGVVLASGLTYQWEVSSDGGSTWSPAHGTLGQSSYTPVAADDGQKLELVVTNPNGPSGSESATYAFGAVQAPAGPAINQGPQTATLADGGVTFASGQFTATDANSNALTWSVVGGSNVTSESYQYGIDQLQVSKIVNGTPTTIFDDTFNGTAPPTGPASNPNQIAYGDNGGTYVAGAGQNGGAAFDGSNAAPLGLSLGSTTYDDLVFGQFTTLLTGTSFNAPQGSGLRSGESFAVNGAFDLTTPADSNTRYGIRLSDRVSGSTGGVYDQPGTETVDLSVALDGNGKLAVQLIEIDFETGVRNLLQNIEINPSSNDNEILLNLSNSASTNGQIQASYTFLENNGSGQEVADGAAHTFTATGNIFGNEDWTRAQFYGQSLATASASPAISVMQGTYGALDVAQNGTWQYYLNPGLASVKALAPGQTAQDVFHVAVTDSNGQHTTQSVTINVEGRPEITINVVTPTGVDFTHQDVLAEMGSGTVQSGGTSSSFTVVDSTDHLQFVVTGSGFTYNGTTLTGGTITSFEEFSSTATPATALANFSGFSVSAPIWISDTQQDAAGNKGPVQTILDHYDLAFVGNSGNDGFGGSAPPGGTATFTGGAGADTFDYSKGSGAVTITDFDQGNNGTFNANEGDTLVLNGFSGQPTFTYVGSNTIVNFGNGDVLTLLGITQQEVPLLHVVNNNGGGNNNGPVIAGAGNTVTYDGSPILIDPSVTLSDSAASVSSVNVWISAGTQSGDQLTINGNVDGQITNSDGSIIHYHFDNTPGTNNGQGPGIFLSNIGTTAATTADFQAALQLIQFSTTGSDPTAGGTDTPRTVTWAAFDNTNFSQTVTTTIDIVPGLNNVTLSVSRGGTTVLTNSDFSVSDPGFTNFTYSVSNVVGGQFEVFNGTNWVSAPTGGFTTAQIAAGHVEFIQDGTATTPNFSIQVSDGVNVSPAIAPTINFTDNYSWSEVQYPAVVQGVHEFGVNPQYDAFAGAVVLAYGDATNYATTDTSLTITRSVEALDPFFLPGRHAAQTVNTSTVELPARYNFVLPNVSFSGTIEPEGIFVYKGQLNSDGTGGNALWEIIGTPDSNGDGGVTFSAPTEIGNTSTTGNTIYDLTESFRNGTNSASAASFDVAWDQYNSATHQFNLELQITPINSNGSFGTPTIFAPVIDENNDTSVSAATNAVLPAWEFRSGAGNYVLAISEVDNQAISALNVSGAHDKIHFQGYANSGASNGVSFDIQPDLTAYAPGATNEIVWQTIPSISPYPGQTVQAIQFVQVSQANNFNYALAWNETVTDTNGTHDQVEFDVLTGNGNGQGSGAVVFHTTFQIANGDPQNLRIGEFVDPTVAGQDDVVIVYGDDTGTHILEYGVTNSGNTVTELASFTDPTTQAFQNLTIMGDGRITLTYDNLVNALPDETSQYLFKTFDLRTSGITINDSSLSDSQNKYFAGTHFSDTVTGENNVNNEYYFVGQDTSSGSGPTDHFTGGNNGWNVAIFSDARADYTITSGGPNAATVSSDGLDPEHTGSLVLSNTQVLAFGPAADPTPHNNTIDVNGGTDVIIGGNAAITIEAGATAEIDTASTYSGSVTFEAPTGTLVLDQPGAFTGQLGGISGSGQVLDLAGAGLTASDLDPTHDTLIASTAGGYNSTTNTTTLTVTDETTNHFVTFNLAGNLSNSAWTVTPDGHGGVDIVDPPTTPDSSGATLTMVTETKPIATITNAATINEVILAGNGLETLTGNGATDQFVFAPTTGPTPAHYTITNFNPSGDTIDLQQFGHTVVSAADLIANHTSQVGNDTLIAVDSNDSILLKNVHAANLHTSDFLVHP